MSRRKLARFLCIIRLYQATTLLPYIYKNDTLNTRSRCFLHCHRQHLVVASCPNTDLLMLPCKELSPKARLKDCAQTTLMEHCYIKLGSGKWSLWHTRFQIFGQCPKILIANEHEWSSLSSPKPSLLRYLCTVENSSVEGWQLQKDNKIFGIAQRENKGSSHLHAEQSHVSEGLGPTYMYLEPSNSNLSS